MNGEVSPVAELAWKLAISMINTARVLHVFVTVIPVSEHLATVLAMVIQVGLYVNTLPQCSHQSVNIPVSEYLATVLALVAVTSVVLRVADAVTTYTATASKHFS